MYKDRIYRRYDHNNVLVPKCIYSIEYPSRSLILISEDSPRGECNYIPDSNLSEDSPRDTLLQSPLYLRGGYCHKLPQL